MSFLYKEKIPRPKRKKKKGLFIRLIGMGFFSLMAVTIGLSITFIINFLIRK